MTTAQTIVNDAYIEARIADAIDGAESDQLTFGLRALNRIIGRLSLKNAFIPYSTSENFSATVGTASYTMGSGGTASSARAIKIISAFARDTSGYDYPMTIISEKDYNSIYDKTFEGIPRSLFYDPVYATGVIYLYPVPDTTYTIYIESQKYLSADLELATTLSLPREFEDALVVTLAAKLARTNGAPTEASLYHDAQSVWKSIAENNLSQRVPTARLPFSVDSASDDLFNVASFPYVFPFLLG